MGNKSGTAQAEVLGIGRKAAVTVMVLNRDAD